MRRLSVATAAAAAALLMSGCVVYPSHGYRHVSGGPVYRDYDQRTYQPDRPYAGLVTGIATGAMTAETGPRSQK